MTGAITTAVVPVAGRGTRLLPATRAVPKALLPLVDRPVVELVVEELAAAGIRRVVLVVGELRAAIEAHFDDGGARLGVDLAFAVQPEPHGLGDAVARGGELAGDQAFVVALGDAVIDDGGRPAGVVRRLVDGFAAQEGTAAAIAVESVSPERTGSYGIVACEARGGRVGGLVEKPDPADAPSTMAVAGRYVLGPEVLDALQTTSPGRGGEIQLTDALDRLCADGRHIVAVPLGGEERRLDVGDAEGYAGAFVERALTDERFGDALRSRASGRG